MSLITVRRPAEARELVLLSRVKRALGIDLASVDQDALLNELIDSASRMVEDFTDRVFARELITEKIGNRETDLRDGFTTRLMLRRTPVLMIEQIRFDGTAIPIDTVMIEDPDAGFLFRPEGFTSTELVRQAIDRVSVGRTEPLWEIDYSAGFILPTFPTISKTFTSTEVNTDDDTITIVGHELEAGDTIRFTTDGTLPAPLKRNRDYFVRDTTTDTFKVAEQRGGAVLDLTSGGSGTHTATRQRTLPASLEQDVVEIVSALHAGKGRNPDVTSEKLGDWSASFADPRNSSGVPHAVASRLERWRDLV